MYVGCVLDLFTREIKGLAVDSHMRTSLVMDALRMAEFRAGITPTRGANTLLLNCVRICKTTAIGNQ